MFPRQLGNAVETILINTAGGITGGDRFDLSATVGADAHLTITTQAAERAYRAQAGEIGQVTTRLTVESGGQLQWLPQELILFERSALHRRLDIDLAPDATLLLVEPIAFGRAAMGETLHDITFRDRITVRQGGRPHYIDAVDLTGNAATQLTRRAVANGAGAMASVVLVRPDANAVLDRVRAGLPDTAGASLIADDTLVLRHLAEDSFALRRDLLPILDHLSNHSLPTSWRL